MRFEHFESKDSLTRASTDVVSLGTFLAQRTTFWSDKGAAILGVERHGGRGPEAFDTIDVFVLIRADESLKLM